MVFAACAYFYRLRPTPVFPSGKKSWLLYTELMLHLSIISIQKYKYKSGSPSPLCKQIEKILFLFYKLSQIAWFSVISIATSLSAKLQILWCFFDSPPPRWGLTHLKVFRLGFCKSGAKYTFSQAFSFLWNKTLG